MYGYMTENVNTIFLKKVSSSVRIHFFYIFTRGIECIMKFHPFSHQLVISIIYGEHYTEGHLCEWIPNTGYILLDTIF